MFLTFWGKPRWAESEHIQHAVHGDHHDHPSDEHADAGDRQRAGHHCPEGQRDLLPQRAVVPHVLFVRPAFWLGRLFWKGGDEGIIDRFGPDGAAWVVEKGAVVARKVQSGYLTSYALIMLLGLVAAISWVLV